MSKAKVFLDVKLPAGGPFTLAHFRGIERLSDLFDYSLLITCPNRDVDFSGLMGKSATASVKVGSKTRTYNGIIGHFEEDDTPFKPFDFQTNYRAILYPKLWLLTFAGQCRIFQHKSTIDIIKSVLGEHQVEFSDHTTHAGRTKLEFCVQYNETDFNFISRLMEQEGIFYFFQQTEGNHVMILGDALSAHHPCPSASSASFHKEAVAEQNMLQVSSCLIQQRIVPKATMMGSYNYLTPQTRLRGHASGHSQGGGGKITVYDQIYEHQSRGDELAKISLQAKELPQKMVTGISTVPFFLAGYKFKLQEHPRKNANIEYTLYEVVHEARLKPDSSSEHLYENTYKAFPSSVTFKAPQITPKPHIYGTQTAKVTGKEGEEIYTEEYGRIKVKFHWDPSPENNESTSCWIRVATLWAGQKWGALYTPRVGQEVVVSFIDGDPDNPLVVGSVYNGDHKPPYRPSEPTKATLKSQTSKKEGEAGFNEFRFEDKRDHEEIYLHAQRLLKYFVGTDWDRTIEDNQNTTIVKGSRTTTLEAKTEKEGNDSLTLRHGNKSLQMDKGNYSAKLMEGNRTTTLMKGNDTLTLTDGNKKTELLKGTDTTILADGNKTTELLKGNDTTTLTDGNKTTTLVKGNSTLTCAKGNISMTTTEGIVTITSSSDLSITGKALTATGSDTVTVSSKSVEVTSTNIAATGESIELTGENTTVSGESIEVSGAEIAISGASIEVSGANIMLSGANIMLEGASITITGGSVDLLGGVTVNGYVPMPIPS